MALFDTTFAPYVPFGSRVLTLGAVGTDVAVVQAVYDLMLTTMNPGSGPIGQPVPISGHFDAGTEAAVRAIQAYFGLTIDGIVGPATYFVYGQGVGPFTTYGGPVYGSRQLAAGASGGDVLILQNRLNCFRYAGILGGPADGSFGPKTTAAVLAFKQDAANNGDTGFPDNGIAGFGFFNATWLYALAGGRALESGRNGFDVVFVQLVLSNLGYYSGRLTGYYDAATQAAVRAFQAAEGIGQDGIVGPVTYYHIGLRNAVSAPAPLGVAWPPPSPSVSITCAPLVTQIADRHPYGTASHAVNLLEGFESLDVQGHALPPPGQFGPAYNAYTFTLTAGGQVVATVTMTALSPEDWAGTYSPGVKTIPPGVVTVYPSGAAGVPFGPAVLAGALT